MRRVAITGLGVVSSVGIGVERFWRSLTEGRSGIVPITHFDASEHPTTFAGMVYDFDPTSILDKKEVRRTSRFIQFALQSAQEAIDSSGLDVSADPERVGVVFGSGIGGLEVMEEQHAKLIEDGPRRVSPFLVPMMITDLAAGQISIKHGARGINYCPVSACATGNHAIGEAAEAIRRGTVDAVIAGSSDAGVTPLGLAGFCAARALSTRNDEPTRASRPFDIARDGFVMGEGAGCVILEEWDRAVERGAPIIAELAGYGATADAHHVTAPSPDGSGAARSMTMALTQAGIDVTDIGYINAHGTSTPAGDAAECQAVNSVFGDHRPAVSSSKSMTGHLLGGAGAVECVALTMAVSTGVLPPTINLDEPDPACDVDHVANEARRSDVSSGMSNSFGFGGHNATLVVRKA